MAFSMAWMSCDIGNSPNLAVPWILDARPAWVVAQGDTPYVGKAYSLYGYSTVPVSADITVEQMLDKHHQHWAKWGWSRLQNARRSGALRIVHQADDHEWGGDNWDHTLVKANAGEAPIGAPDQASANEHWWIGLQAVMRSQALYCDNPAPRAANGDRPSGCLLDGNDPPASRYPVRYFHVDVAQDGLAPGQHARLIFLDAISYRSALSEADGPGKTMLGVTQAQWLIDLVIQAHDQGFPFILVFCSKKLFGARTVDNADTFEAYVSERDRILRQTCAAGARMIWLSGDRHMPHVMEVRRSDIQALDICACPVGVSLNGIGADSRLSWVGYSQVFGQVDVAEGSLVARLRSATNGSDLWRCTIAARSNHPEYELPTVQAVSGGIAAAPDSPRIRPQGA